MLAVGILGAHVEELNLLKGSLLSSSVLASTGRNCPKLRYYLRIFLLNFICLELNAILSLNC